MENNKQHNKPGWNTADSDFYRNYSEARKDLLNSMTPAEKLLWQKPKGKNLGIKFRRQHIVESFIPDFVALSIKLIVEVDGKIHLKQKEKDKERTQILEMIGYKIIRFTNEQVENELDNVVKEIKYNIELLIPPNPAYRQAGSPKGRSSNDTKSPLGGFRGSLEILMKPINKRIND